MSADNGVYIGRFLVAPKDSEANAYYYRVIHAQAIESCDYQLPHIPEKVTQAYLVTYYGDAKVFTSGEEAREYAAKLEEEIMSSNFPVLEYGVTTIPYDEPFPSMTMDEARNALEDYDHQQEQRAKTEQEKRVAVKCLVTKGMFEHEYFVMIQDYPSRTPVIWRGWIDRNSVRINAPAGTTIDGYHLGEVYAYKIKEEVKTEEYASGSTSSQLMYLIEFTAEGIGGRRVWVEPKMVSQW